MTRQRSEPNCRSLDVFEMALFALQPLAVLIGGIVTDDRDIWRTAHTLIEQYCEQAPIHAAMRCDELLAQGDIEGRDVWVRVLGAILELRGQAPVEGEKLN